jgi:hypothetical protein
VLVLRGLVSAAAKKRKVALSVRNPTVA